MNKLLYISFFLLVFTSCEKIFIADDPIDDPVSNFDHLWTRLDEQYAYFEYRNIDWDSIYNVYRAKVSEDIQNDSLFRVMSNMLFELRDGHVNLMTAFDISRNWEWYLDRPQNFDFSILERNYLGDNYRITGSFINTVFDSVGYIRYASFSDAIYNNQIDALLKAFSNYKGLVIDVRDNGGGYVSNAELLASKFIDEEQVVGYTSTKNGTEHDDFTIDKPIILEPSMDDDMYSFNKPVVILTNRSCYSSTTMFATYMSGLDHVTIVGDTTGGGGGLPITYQLPNGWRVRYSSTITMDKYKFNVEHGVPADIVVTQTSLDLANGVDPILVRGVQEIISK